MLCYYQQLTHTGIQSLCPYVAGKSVEELAEEQGIKDIIKLASNENPLGCSPLVKEALNKLSSLQIATYPTPLLHPLRRKLSKKLGVDVNTLTLSNGSDTLFSLLLIIFGLQNNKHMLTHEKAFISYAIQAQTLGIPVKTAPLKNQWEVDIDTLITASNEDTALIFLANPNNPTGLAVPSESIKQLLTSLPPATIVVIDEAYYEYTPVHSRDETIALMAQFPNLVITRTFSKAYGLAGLRLGYAIAHPEISELLQRIQLPFTVNQAVLAAAFSALDDQAFLDETYSLTTQGLEQVSQSLDALGCKPLPSCCNFITFDCGVPALPVYQQLLQQGVIVRPLTPYGLPQHLRVTMGKLAHNERFLNSLETILSKQVK